MKVSAALLVLALFTSCEQSSPGAVAQPAAAKKTESQPIDEVPASFLGQDTDLSNITITNFKQVDPGVYRGARPMKEQITQLASIGVRTVIDLQGGDGQLSDGAGWIMDQVEPGESAQDIAEENQEVLAAGITNFYNLALNSFEDVNAQEAVKIQTALEIISDPTKQPVFVHCEHGKDRTGLVMALYRVDYDQWIPEAAHDEMIQMGHTGELDHLFTGRLDRYFYQVTGWQPGLK